MGAELELQCGDIPAGVAPAHRATAVRRTAGAPERAARGGSGDTVSGEARTPLDRANSRDRAGAADAVDSASVGARGAQGDLQRGDVGAPGGAGRRRGATQHGERGEQSKWTCTGTDDSPAFGARTLYLPAGKELAAPAISRPGDGVWRSRAPQAY